MADHTNYPLMSGVEHDVNKLLDAVVNLFHGQEELKFQYFTQVWQEMKFSLIFCGRQSFRMLAEFTEDIFHIVKNKFLQNGKDFARQAVCLYLLYGLYFKQPLYPPVRLRWTLNQYRQLLDFIMECRSKSHWEVVYIWAKLVKENAFYYSSSNTSLGIEMALVAEGREGYSQDCSQQTRNPFQSEECQMSMTKLASIHEKYQNMKNALKNPIGEDPGLSLVLDDFPNDLINIANSAYEPKEIEQQGNVLVEHGLTIGDRRRKLIASAFANNKSLDQQDSSDVIDDEDMKASPNEMPTNCPDDPVKVKKSRDVETLDEFGIDLETLRKKIFE